VRTLIFLQCVCFYKLLRNYEVELREIDNTFCSDGAKGRGHLGDVEVHGRVILKQILWDMGTWQKSWNSKKIRQVTRAL
jgi:hypothetical protein